MDLSDYLRGEMSNGNLIGMICIDLQKAFDTVDYSVLLEKLGAIGVSESALNWFQSYLFNRQQCVEVDGNRSCFMEVTCGVPQGSILGPQLFLLYINNMHSSLTCKLSLYADDSALFFSHKDPAVIANVLGNELSNCQKWLIDNKLSLHMGKIECLLFGSKRRLKRVRDFQITCDGMALKRVESVQYLGVRLDCNMSGEPHAIALITKCNSRVSFLFRYSSLLDNNTRRILCSALVQPLLDYCCSSWYSGLSRSLRERIDVIQRRMVRFIFSYDSRQHVDSRDLRRLFWMSIPERVSYFKLLHVFKIRNNLAPDYLSKRFTLVEQTHQHNTRGRRFNFSISSSISESLLTFSYTAAILWNTLPNSIKEVTSLSVFRKRLRSHLMQP